MSTSDISWRETIEGMQMMWTCMTTTVHSNQTKGQATAKQRCTKLRLFVPGKIVWAVVFQVKKFSMFHVVKFVDSNEVEVVPDIWISSNGNECAWPNMRGDTLKKAAKTQLQPDKDWKLYKVKCLYSSERYEEARKKLPQAEVFSDIQSETEILKKPRRIMNYRHQDYTSESEEDTPSFHCLEPLPRIRTPSAVPLKSSQPPTNQSQRFYQPEVQSQTSPSSACFQQASPPEPFQQHISMDQFLFARPSGNLQEPPTQPMSPCAAYGQEQEPTVPHQFSPQNVQLQTVLKELLTKQEMILDQQKRIMSFLQAVHQSVPQLSGNFCKNNIPVECVEELQSLEIELRAQDSALKSDLIVCLGHVGGLNLKDTVWRIMKAAISTPLACQMNWRGTNGKVPLHRLELKSVIIDAVRQNPLTSTALNKEVELLMVKWLQLAGDRDGGRKRRQKI